MKTEPTLKKCATCDEETYNDRLCRDCDLAELFDKITCSVCSKLRTEREGRLGKLADSFYGADHRCECEPQPPTLFEATHATGNPS